MLALLGSAVAAPGDGDVLFEEGRALRDEGKYEEACAKFARAYEIDDGAGIAVNLADCHERFGRLTEAWRLFDQVSRRVDIPVRVKFARDRAAALAQRLATVVIGVPEPRLDGLAIQINDRRVVPAAEIRDVVDPGSISIIARAPGKAPFVRARTVAAGETAVIEVDLSDEVDLGARRRTRIRIALGLGAVGAASLAGALGVSLYGRSKYNDAVTDRAHCDPGDPPRCDAIGSARIDAAQRYTTIGTGLAIGGGVLALASAIVYVTAPSAVTVTPVSTTALTGVSLAVRF